MTNACDSRHLRQHRTVPSVPLSRRRKLPIQPARRLRRLTVPARVNRNPRQTAHLQWPDRLGGPANVLKKPSLNSNVGDDGSVKPGAWYLCAICETCRQPILVMEICENTCVGGDDSVLWEIPCPYCDAKHRYRLQGLLPLQAQAAGPPGEQRH